MSENLNGVHFGGYVWFPMVEVTLYLNSDVLPQVTLSWPLPAQWSQEGVDPENATHIAIANADDPDNTKHAYRKNVDGTMTPITINPAFVEAMQQHGLALAENLGIRYDVIDTRVTDPYEGYDEPFDSTGMIHKPTQEERNAYSEFCWQKYNPDWRD